MFKNLAIKLNEINYYYGEKVAKAELCRPRAEHHPRGLLPKMAAMPRRKWTMSFSIPRTYLALPQPPLILCAHAQYTGQVYRESSRCDRHRRRHAAVRQCGCDDETGAASVGHTERNGALAAWKARRTCVGACVGSYIPYETGHPVEGQPNLGKIIELTMNNGFDPRIQTQVGPRREIQRPSRISRNSMRPLRSSSNSVEDTSFAMQLGSRSMLHADFLPCTWRSVLTRVVSRLAPKPGRAEPTTTPSPRFPWVVWMLPIRLMAVKDLVFDKKKLTMAELKAALAANFEGEYEKVHKMCYQDTRKTWQRHR